MSNHEYVKRVMSYMARIAFLFLILLVNFSFSLPSVYKCATSNTDVTLRWHILLSVTRPFARRLPEFKFWYQCIKAVWISFIMTFFSIFDIAVFWPILAMYFCVLFVLTMKRQIRHMIKHRYLPFSWGKAKYQGKAPAKESK